MVNFNLEYSVLMNTMVFGEISHCALVVRIVRGAIVRHHSPRWPCGAGCSAEMAIPSASSQELPPRLLPLAIPFRHGQTKVAACSVRSANYGYDFRYLRVELHAN